jgi:predicted regulator of Ras-like GTPase activity (Roadblock/LC7/MglB family)
VPDRFKNLGDAYDPLSLVRPYMKGWRSRGKRGPAPSEPDPEPEPGEPDWFEPAQESRHPGREPAATASFTTAIQPAGDVVPDRPNDIPAGQPAQREQLIGPEMNKQEELARVIYNVRSSIPELHGMMIASTDGLPISHDFPESEAERVAAMAATTLGLGKRMTERTNLGALQESVVRGDYGYLVVYAAGENAALVMSGPVTSNLGLMRIEARAASAVVSKVLG